MYIGSYLSKPDVCCSTHENIPQLRQNIQALEKVSRHLFLEAHDLQDMREQNKR